MQRFAGEEKLDMVSACVLVHLCVSVCPVAGRHSLISFMKVTFLRAGGRIPVMGLGGGTYPPFTVLCVLYLQ